MVVDVGSKVSRQSSCLEASVKFMTIHSSFENTSLVDYQLLHLDIVSIYISTRVVVPLKRIMETVSLVA